MQYDIVGEREKEMIDRYAQGLKGSVIEVVGRAIDALGPCRLSYGNGKATFAVNRRNNKEPDVPRLRRAAVARAIRS